MARRRPAKPQTKIDWLEHRSGYPSPEEREAIIQSRRELRMELLKLIAKSIDPDTPAGRQISAKYDQEEIAIVTNQIKKTLGGQGGPLAGPIFVYREYRQRYARFGAGKPILNTAEFLKKNDEHATHFLESLKNNLVYTPEGQKLVDLLMFDSELWEDITPEGIPPRPDSFPPPPVSDYKEPLTEMLTWGPRLLPLSFLVKDWDVWEKHIPALTHMVLDPALLHGWPGDKASWAPWYAMHMLAELEATESAYTLGELADTENDWLTDHLPHVWADMGLEVEPILMMILDDQKFSDKRRGLAAQALTMLVHEEPILRRPVTETFGRYIASSATSPTLTAHLIHFLGDLDSQNEFRPAIEAAFAENRVDTEFISLEDMDWMDDEDWDDED